MITKYKERELHFGERYQVYRNLHKSCFSVRSISTRLVIAHVTNLLLIDSKLVVSSIGKQRVRDTKRKNVHAYVDGIVDREITLATLLEEGYTLEEITYCPYTNDSFVFAETGQEVNEVDVLYVDEEKIYKVTFN